MPRIESNLLPYRKASPNQGMFTACRQSLDRYSHTIRKTLSTRANQGKCSKIADRVSSRVYSSRSLARPAEISAAQGGTALPPPAPPPPQSSPPAAECRRRSGPPCTARGGSVAAARNNSQSDQKLCPVQWCTHRAVARSQAAPSLLARDPRDGLELRTVVTLQRAAYHISPL